jgi:lysophospholipase L1-like esterase
MPDEEQRVWFEIFKEYGADIILGDHPHVVEPVQIEKTKEKTVFTAYCPGNFANIYRENQGDTSMLVDVYIDRESKTVIGGSVVPLYTQAMSDGNYRAIPIYEIMNDNELRKCLSTDDLERAKTAHGIITEVLFGKKMDISGVTERYFMDQNGFMRSRTPGLGLTEQQKQSTLYKALQKADTVCFIGDSVTEGTKNGGCPWYEPLTENLPDKQFYNVSKGGCTVSYMTEHVDKIPKADLYVVALGTNDVRYREEDTCAMTEQDYVKELGRLKKALQGMDKDVAIIFIAPWYSTDADPYCPLSYAEKTSLNEKYTEALETYCKQEKCGFINANPYIRKRLEQRPDKEYLLDHIHPNASKGVRMYTEAVLSQ